MSRLWERSRARFDCLLHGHRDLTRAAAYAEFQSGAGDDNELHYCGECGGPAWISKPRRRANPPTWAATGLKNP